MNNNATIDNIGNIAGLLHSQPVFAGQNIEAGEESTIEFRSVDLEDAFIQMTDFEMKQVKYHQALDNCTEKQPVEFNMSWDDIAQDNKDLWNIKRIIRHRKRCNKHEVKVE